MSNQSEREPLQDKKEAEIDNLLEELGIACNFDPIFHMRPANPTEKELTVQEELQQDRGWAERSHADGVVEIVDLLIEFKRIEGVSLNKLSLANFWLTLFIAHLCDLFDVPLEPEIA